MANIKSRWTLKLGLIQNLQPEPSTHAPTLRHFTAFTAKTAALSFYKRINCNKCLRSAINKATLLTATALDATTFDATTFEAPTFRRHRRFFLFLVENCNRDRDRWHDSKNSISAPRVRFSETPKRNNLGALPLFSTLKIRDLIIKFCKKPLLAL